METRISTTMGTRKSSDLVNRVRYRGEVFVIERGSPHVGSYRPEPFGARLRNS